MMLITKTIVDCLANFGLEAAKKYTENKIDEVKLKRNLKTFIESQKKYNKVCSLAEECDFQGLMEYILTDLMDDVQKRFFSPKSKERDKAQKMIVSSAVDHSQAVTEAARKRVAQIISMSLEIIGAAFKKKISLKEYFLVIETVDAVKENTDEAIKNFESEIKETISESQNTILKEINKKSMTSPNMDSVSSTSGLAKENQPSLKKDKDQRIIYVNDDEWETLMKNASLEGIKMVDADAASKLSEEDLEDFSESTLQYMRSALGKDAERLSNVELLTRFLNMTDFYIENKVRYNAPQYMLDVPRNKRKADLYTNDEFSPVECGYVIEFFWDEYDKFVYESEHIQLETLYKNGDLIDFVINFKVLDELVVDRLNAFDIVKKIFDAEKIKIIIDSADQRVLKIPSGTPGDMWDGKMLARYKLDLWYERMLKLRTIEDFYEIEFKLEIIIGEDIIQQLYEAVDFVYYGIILQANCSITMPKNIFDEVDEDIIIIEPIVFQELDALPLPPRMIHNICFVPFQSWLLPGKIHIEEAAMDDKVQIQGCCRYKIMK